MGLNVYPVTIRGPHSTTSSHLVTFARIISTDDALYIAESRDKGFNVVSVTRYDLPEGEPEKRPGTKAGKWGPWSWSGCGCSNQWGRWKTETLLGMAGTDGDSE